MNVSVPDNEKNLLLQASEGDEKAFRLLFDAYHNRLYFYILKITSSKQVTEDIVQDTFLKIWLYRNKLSKVECFSAYIFRMAQNAVLTTLRRKVLEEGILEGKLERPIADSTPDEQLDVKLIRDIVRKAVDELPPQQKTVFLFRRQDGYHIREIALMMNISEITVKRHLTEAQKNLRHMLESTLSHDAEILLMVIVFLHQW